VPLWHATIFPPFFVPGHLLRIRDGGGDRDSRAQVYKLEDFFSDHHLDIMGK